MAKQDFSDWSAIDDGLFNLMYNFHGISALASFSNVSPYIHTSQTQRIGDCRSLWLNNH